MNIRNLIIFSIIGLSLLLLIFRPYPISRLPFFPISGIEAIPANAGICFEMKSLQAFRNSVQSNSYTNQLQDLYPFQQFSSDFDLLEDVLKTDSAIHTQLLHTPMISVMQNGGLDAVNYLYIIETTSSNQAGAIKNWLTELSTVNITSTVFKNEQVYKVKPDKGTSFSFVAFRNLLLIGRYPLLIEDAINQLKVVRKPFFTGFSFRSALALPDPLRVYIRPANLPLMFLPFLNKKGKKQLDVLYDSDELLAVDVLFEEEGVELKGSLALSGKSSWLRAIKKQKAINRKDVAKILPGHTALIQWLSISDVTAFNNEKEDDLFEKYFQPWLGDHGAHVTTEPYSINLDAENFLLLAAKDADLGEHYMEKLGQAEGELEAYEYMTYNIRQIMTNRFFAADAWPHSTFKNPFITFIDGYLLAAQSQQALEIWIDKYNAGQVLTNKLAYLQSVDQLGDKAKWWAHFHTDNARQLLVTYLRKEYEADFNEQFKIAKSITPMDFILDEKGALNGFLSPLVKQEKSASILWKSRLSKDIIGTPVVVEHANNKQFEVLVQDKSNMLYLMNSGGDIVWKKQLDGSLLSTIHQIDYYKNNQVHFLFNTAGSIYLYNNDGVAVSNFPIKLRSKATNGVVAVDFDGLKNYNFFVACRNDKLYGFKKTGSPLDGWPQSGIRRVTYEVLHFQQEEKDFLVVLNTKGKLMAFDRKGKKRFKDLRLNESFASPPDFDDIESAPRIVAVTNKGEAYVVNLYGDKFKLNVNVGKNKSVQFAYTDLLGDQRKDYLVSSENEIAAYAYQEDDSFSKAFNITTDSRVDALFPVSVPGKTNPVIGTVTMEKGQINLYSSEGKRFKNFPLAGTTPFQIIKLYKSGENILIVGNGDSVFVYRLR